MVAPDPLFAREAKGHLNSFSTLADSCPDSLRGGGETCTIGL